MVFRVYAEKKPGFNVEAQHLCAELKSVLRIPALKGVRIVNRYDVEGITEQLFEQCIPCVFSEPQSDNVYRSIGEFAEEDAQFFAVEYLPGQFDQRASSAAECVQLISAGVRPTVRSAKVYVLEGALSPRDIQRIKEYVINPIEAREATLEVPETLHIAHAEPADVEILHGFNTKTCEQLEQFIEDRGLAMDVLDITFCQEYFAHTEHREPTITEIKMIDTYWSDHCRHTTFGTILDGVEIEDAAARATYERYLDLRRELGREQKPICLMDMATIGAKYLQHTGLLKNLDESEEINACTVKVRVDVDGEKQDWLYLFKNETHNHPTEVEPFGGAATCIGGAIRDPLSGRAYVYQAMRVSGAADPRVPVEETLPGKLPQRKLTTTAAAGYSSYGNQIGIATGQVCELYHSGFAAKRMEIGAVVAATPAAHVVRETPAPGDAIILLGGRTGRDGIGGATGSSKAHTTSSLSVCGAEVQKGNAPVERKLQRLFRRGEACKLIKRCNDFGAGGVSVATGEIADGLLINLDKVPKKYDGLDGTELAISESQERMACAVAPEHVAEFLRYAEEENLEATVIAEVTAEPRLKMMWRGSEIVNVSREFLNSNGAPKHASAHVCAGGAYSAPWEGAPAATQVCERAGAGAESAAGATDGVRASDTFKTRMLNLLTNLNVACNKGLTQRFDSTIGAGSVLMPHGGAHQLTPACAMVSKLPTGGDTTTVSGMAWGYNPRLSSANQYAGAYLAVLESVCKLVAAGFEKQSAYLTFQEYFGKLQGDPDRWGKPVGSLLGALAAQLDLGVGAIGGKDSMSGTFNDLDVPPTLVSFATAVGDIENVTSPEFKAAGNVVLLVEPAAEPVTEAEVVKPAATEGGAEGAEANAITSGSEGASATQAPSDATSALIPPATSTNESLALVEQLIREGSALSANVVGAGGVAEAIFKMCVGNTIGVALENVSEGELFAPAYGSFVVELSSEDAKSAVACAAEKENVRVRVIGKTTAEYTFVLKGVGTSGTSSESAEHETASSAEVAQTETLDLAELQKAWEGVLEDVFPYKHAGSEDLQCKPITYAGASQLEKPPAILTAKPRVVIPVFPGNNCEIDSARAFGRAGACVHTLVVNNLTPAAVTESIARLAAEIDAAHIVMIPGGFSGGDEPDGSAKFITAFFRNPRVTQAVRELLQVREGLMLGICNGFQALVKLGLVPFGDIVPMRDNCPTLTFNNIGRHQSGLVHTRVCSNASPWLRNFSAGDVHTVAISHGEGRFVADASTLDKMRAQGQIAFQYCDAAGVPGAGLDVNPNGSVWAIEGITSPHGRVLGKMGHSERSGAGLYKNVPSVAHQDIFTAGVSWFM